MDPLGAAQDQVSRSRLFAAPPAKRSEAAAGRPAANFGAAKVGYTFKYRGCTSVHVGQNHLENSCI